MTVSLPLEKMSREEKLQAMEAIWADLSRNEKMFNSPAWHEQTLRETEKLVETGEAKFSDWDEAKKRMRAKAEKLA